MGGRSKAFYRIVAANSEAPRDGSFLEILGHYDPKKDPAEIVLKVEEIKNWLSRGAKPTVTVARFLEKQGILV
jgi:small subunit ribosomal protein S16